MRLDIKIAFHSSDYYRRPINVANGMESILHELAEFVVCLINVLVTMKTMFLCNYLFGNADGNIEKPKCNNDKLWHCTPPSQTCPQIKTFRIKRSPSRALHSQQHPTDPPTTEHVTPTRRVPHAASPRNADMLGKSLEDASHRHDRLEAEHGRRRCCWSFQESNMRCAASPVPASSKETMPNGAASFRIGASSTIKPIQTTTVSPSSHGYETIKSR